MIQKLKNKLIEAEKALEKRDNSSDDSSRSSSSERFSSPGAKKMNDGLLKKIDKLQNTKIKTLEKKIETRKLIINKLTAEFEKLGR